MLSLDWIDLKRVIVAVFILIASQPVAVSEMGNLKEQMRQLTQRTERLEIQEKSQFQESRATTGQSGKSMTKLSLSGWIDRGILYADDGGEDITYFVDGAFPPRIILHGRTSVEDSWTVGFVWELQYRSNSTFSVDQFNQKTGVTDGAFKERRLEIYFSNPEAGKLYLGQGYTASDGITQSDLSGTMVAGYSNTWVHSGGVRFRSSDGVLKDNDSTSPRILHVFSNMDGLGLTDRIRYDSPRFGNVYTNIGAVQGDYYDASCRYGADMIAIN